MKLKATFAPRRDGAFGRVMDTTNVTRMDAATSYQIDDNGIVDVPEGYAKHLISTGNFTLVDGQKQPEPSAMMITNEHASINLMELEHAALLQLANDVFCLNMNVKCGEKRLRDEIFAHVNKLAE